MPAYTNYYYNNDKYIYMYITHCGVCLLTKADLLYRCNEVSRMISFFIIIDPCIYNIIACKYIYPGYVYRYPVLYDFYDPWDPSSRRTILSGLSDLQGPRRSPARRLSNHASQLVVHFLKAFLSFLIYSLF